MTQEGKEQKMSHQATKETDLAMLISAKIDLRKRSKGHHLIIQRFRKTKKNSKLVCPK